MKRLPGARGLLELEGKTQEESMLNAKDYGVFFDAHQGDGSSNFIIDFEVPDFYGCPLKWKFDPNEATTEIPGKTPNSALPYKAKNDSWATKPAIGIRRHVVGFPRQQAFLPTPFRIPVNSIRTPTRRAGGGCRDSSSATTS